MSEFGTFVRAAIPALVNISVFLLFAFGFLNGDLDTLPARASPEPFLPANAILLFLYLAMNARIAFARFVAVTHQEKD